jgi:hypothetical protein
MLVTQWNATRFVLKHTAAAAIVIGGSTLLAAASYLVLFLRAVASGADIGSPVAFPFMVLGGAAAAVVSVVVVLMPATISAEAAAWRLGLRILWQIPISAAVTLGLATGGGLLYAVVSSEAVSTSLAMGAAAGGALLVPLGVYWWALQSADWVLRTGGRMLGRIWPSRFRGLAAAPGDHVGSISRLARFKVREQFTLDVVGSPMLVISGDILEGVVRSGMRACAIVEDREISARIHSVEYVGSSISDRVSNVGLLLPVSELDLRIWQSAARNGAELRIV